MKKQKTKAFSSFAQAWSNERGQVTIFIIIAVAIIALGILIYFFFPKIQTGFGISTNNPQIFIQNCMEEKIENVVSVLSSQGGSSDPENYFLYQDEKIEYLCYTGEYYIPCVMQQPMLKKHIENEIKNEISNEKKACFDSLRENFESLGYAVSLTRGETKVELLPNRIVVGFTDDLTLTKDDSERYDKLSVVVDNNLYELVSIANSILNMEARYGDSETTIYMNYYHDLKVEKMKQTDGTTLYILTDRNKGDKFQFASRSIAWPPGI
jgi:hypothetical protein|tara:strand:+ start:1748 stop:2548 length:801 start_codon:yes stop_codon:yes gene_type:complete